MANFNNLWNQHLNTLRNMMDTYEDWHVMPSNPAPRAIMLWAALVLTSDCEDINDLSKEHKVEVDLTTNELAEVATHVADWHIDPVEDTDALDDDGFCRVTGFHQALDITVDEALHGAIPEFVHDLARGLATDPTAKAA